VRTELIAAGTFYIDDVSKQIIVNLQTTVIPAVVAVVRNRRGEDGGELCKLFNSH
jgi:hypothetical protein